MSASCRFVDLSHELADGIAPYPGLPAPLIGAYLDHAASRAARAELPDGDLTGAAVLLRSWDRAEVAA